MKTPVQMLEVFVSDIIENTVLLENIYKKSNENYETDCSLNSLIRSMKKTVDNMNEYIKTYNNETIHHKRAEIKNDLADDIFDAVLTAKKLETVTQTYSESYFTSYDNDNPSCHMSAVICDYAHKLCSDLKSIEEKLN